MGKMKQLDMAKQELEAMSEPQEREQVINRDGKETKFFLSDLSNNAQRSYVRANQLAQEMVQLEMNLEENRLLANSYINNVLLELEENKEEQMSNIIADLHAVLDSFESSPVMNYTNLCQTLNAMYYAWSNKRHQLCLSLEYFDLGFRVAKVFNLYIHSEEYKLREE